MSQQCGCINSYLFPHRVEKCVLIPKKTNGKAALLESPTMVEAICLPPNPDSDDALLQDDQIRVIDAAGRPLGIVSRSDPNVVIAEEVSTCTATPFNGSEQCDCIAYRLTPHRKNKCTLKRHLRPAVAGTAVAADDMVFAAVSTSSNRKDKVTKDDTLSGESDSYSADGQQEHDTNEKNGKNEENEDDELAERVDIVGESSARRSSSLNEACESSSSFHHSLHHSDIVCPPDKQSQKEGGKPLCEENSPEKSDHNELSPTTVKDQQMRERAERAAQLHAKRLEERRIKAEQEQQERERQIRAEKEEEPEVHRATAYVVKDTNI